MIKEMRLMTETAVETEQAEQVQAPSSAVSDEQLVAMLVDRARNRTHGNPTSA
jgi:putative transposase